MKEFFNLTGILKNSLCVFGMLFLSAAFAEHTEHNYLGSHGMALISSPDDEVFAHHLPLYSKPHDYQIIYKIRLSDEARAIFDQHEFLTLLPERFDLAKLINGHSFALSATLFTGHFERSGEIVHVGDVEFVSPIYIRSLSDAGLDIEAAVFDHIKTAEDSQLIVHRIRKSPSYDVVAWLPKGHKQPEGNTTVCNEPAVSVQSYKAIAQLLESCFGVSAAYLEFQDFQ